MNGLRLTFGALAIATAVACTSHAQFLPGSSSYAIRARELGFAKPTPTPHAIIALGRLSGASTKSGMFIRVQLGGERPRPFLFDSGSQGFWMYANVFDPSAKGYKSTGVTAYNQYGSDITYSGTVYTGPISFVDSNIGKLTTQDVPFVVVQTAGCVTGTTCPATPSLDNCPNVFRHQRHAKDAGILCLEEGRKLFGTFGADLEPTVEPKGAKGGPNTAVLYNTLYGLGSWATSFMVNQTQLELGPKPNLYRDFTTILMDQLPKPLPTKLPNEARGWLLHVHLCYHLAGYTKKLVCLPSLFDTGAADMSFRGSPPTTKSVPIYAPCNVLAKGIPATVTVESNGAAGPVLGSFATGYTTNYDAVKFLKPKKGKPDYVNTGLTFFNRNEIYFDGVRGFIGLHALSKPGNIGTSPCSKGAGPEA